MVARKMINRERYPHTESPHTETVECKNLGCTVWDNTAVPPAQPSERTKVVDRVDKGLKEAARRNSEQYRDYPPPAVPEGHPALRAINEGMTDELWEEIIMTEPGALQEMVNKLGIRPYHWQQAGLGRAWLYYQWSDWADKQMRSEDAG